MGFTSYIEVKYMTRIVQKSREEIEVYYCKVCILYMKMYNKFKVYTLNSKVITKITKQLGWNKKFHFTKATKMKYLEINLTKDVQDLFT